MRKRTIALLVLVVSVVLLASCKAEKKPSDSTDTPQQSIQQAEPDKATDAPQDEQNKEQKQSGQKNDNNKAAPQGVQKSEQKPTGWKNLRINTVDLYGRSVTDADFAHAKLTLLNFWGTWCPPCVRELPELQRVSEAFAGRGVQVIGVLEDGVTESGSPNDNKINDAKSLLSSAGVKYTVILPDETLTTDFLIGMQSFPTTYFIDNEGNVIHSAIGARDFEGWSDEINGVLGKISQ